jgi:TPR repeat protein
MFQSTPKFTFRQVLLITVRHESRLRERLLPALRAQGLSDSVWNVRTCSRRVGVRRTRRTQSVLTCTFKVLLSCLLFLAPVHIASSQMKLPEGSTVLEVAVNDQLLALTKEQIPKLIESATADDIQAECVLGMAYQRGIIVPHNDAEAIKWLTRGAMHGVAWVQNFLGNMYRGGAGVAQDYSEALRWYRASAEQHYAAAADNLGYMYLNGMGVKRDNALAATWYATAAEQGYAPAQNNLGELYQHGRGVRKDYTLAVRLYRQAVQHGLASAQNNLGAVYEAGLGVPRDYTEAVKWYRAAAEQSDPVGESNLAFMYAHGQGVRRDLEESSRWLLKSPAGLRGFL